jgi:hypothetical protein
VIGKTSNGWMIDWQQIFKVIDEQYMSSILAKRMDNKQTPYVTTLDRNNTFAIISILK